MKKFILILIFTFLLVLLLCGCAGKETGSEQKEQTNVGQSGADNETGQHSADEDGAGEDSQERWRMGRMIRKKMAHLQT